MDYLYGKDKTQSQLFVEKFGGFFFSRLAASESPTFWVSPIQASSPDQITLAFL